MVVIGIAGLPGSGKSSLIRELEADAYICYDDVNRDWKGNIPKARTEAQRGKNVAVSDIMFCEESWQRRLEEELGVPVQWIFFRNDLWQCAKNCLYRFMFEKRHRPLQEEIRKICELSARYVPQGDVRPVAAADRDTPHACG
jgi:RNase adaptor protein for sRNA GlmZ degradation